MKEKKQKNLDNKVGLGKLLLWQSSPLSVTVSTLLIDMWIIFYCTDILHLNAGIVGAIFAASKIIDAFTDFAAGFIVDRTNTKMGKGRPYEIFMVLLWISTWLLFNVPANFSDVAKYLWLFVMYAFAKSICTTFLNANNVVYMVRAFKTREQHTKVTAYGAFFGMLAGFIFNIAFPIAMTKVAADAAGWSRLVLIMGIPLTIVGLLRILTIKEEYNNEHDITEQRIVPKDIVILFRSNKNVTVVAIVLLVINIACNLGVTTYYWKYIVGNTALMGIASMATILGVPMAFALPAMRRKLGQKQMCMVGFYGQIIGCIFFLIAGKSIPLVCIGQVFWTIGNVPFTQMINMMIVDCADYNEMKGNPRMEGTLGSVFGLTKKIGAALGTLVIGVFLNVVNYNNTLPLGIDNQAALIMIRMMMSVVPMIFMIVVIIIMKRYHVDEELKAWREQENMKKNDVECAE